MAISRTPVDFSIDGKPYEAMSLTDDSSGGGAKPTILVFHHWAGRAEDMLVMAERMVSWGYNAFACDLYGKGVLGSSTEENAALMTPMMEDRDLLAKKMLANIETASGRAEVDADNLGAIGFCFGGLCVLDLARINAPVKGVVSMHGLLKPRPESPSEPIRPKAAIHHGWDDPMAPPEDVVAIGKEFTARGADWQLNAYGGAVHAFTTPHAAARDQGLQYDAKVARRAFASAQDFLEEVFS